MIKYTIKNCEMYLASSEELLTMLSDKSVDAIVTDPPYQYIKHKLDKPFNELVVFKNIKRILRENKLIAFFGFGAAFHRWNLQLNELGFKHKETLVWDKTHASNPFNNIARTAEFISILAKGNASVNKCYIDFFKHCVSNNKIDSLEKNYKSLLSSFNNPKNIDEIKDYLEKGIIKYSKVRTSKNNITVPNNTKKCSTDIDTLKSFKIGVRETSIIRCKRESNYEHPTQKPIELMSRIIKLVTKENDIVLDPFAGGGSTGIACVKNNRHFIGIEIDKGYFDLACKRISEACNSLDNA